MIIVKKIEVTDKDNITGKDGYRFYYIEDELNCTDGRVYNTYEEAREFGLNYRWEVAHNKKELQKISAKKIEINKHRIYIKWTAIILLMYSSISLYYSMFNTNLVLRLDITTTLISAKFLVLYCLLFLASVFLLKTTFKKYD